MTQPTPGPEDCVCPLSRERDEHGNRIPIEILPECTYHNPQVEGGTDGP